MMGTDADPPSTSDLAEDGGAIFRPRMCYREQCCLDPKCPHLTP